MTAEANVGVVGLAAMGASLARNLARHGNKVAVFNRHYSRTEKLITEHGSEGEFFPAKTMEEFVASLKKPRTAIIMVKAGEPTDAMIGQLADLMEPGDIIVDAGNAHFPDTIRREKRSAPAACTSSAAACPVARKAPCSDLDDARRQRGVLEDAQADLRVHRGEGRG